MSIPKTTAFSNQPFDTSPSSSQFPNNPPSSFPSTMRLAEMLSAPGKLIQTRLNLDGSLDLSTSTPPAVTARTTPKKTVTELKKCLDGALPDVSVFIGPEKKEFRLHKKLLCQYSGYFHRMFESGGTGFKEAFGNEIYLPEHDPICFVRMIKPVYDGRTLLSSFTRSTLEFDESITMFAYASYFDVPSLKKKIIHHLIVILKDAKVSQSIKTNKASYNRFVDAMSELFAHYSAEVVAMEPLVQCFKEKDYLPLIMASGELRAVLVREPELMMKFLGMTLPRVDAPTVVSDKGAR